MLNDLFTEKNIVKICSTGKLFVVSLHLKSSALLSLKFTGKPQNQVFFLRENKNEGKHLEW